MKAILNDLNDVPGVTGSFVCDGDGRVLISSLKTTIPSDVLDKVARTLNRTAEGVHSLQGKRTLDVEMVYASGILLLKPLEPGCLCILCTPKVSIPMLNLTANMAVRKLKKAIAGGAVAPAGPAPGGAAIPSQAIGRAEHELAVAVGPVAMLIVDEALARVGASRETLTEAQVPAFLEALSAEIPDAAKKPRFIEAARRILTP